MGRKYEGKFDARGKKLAIVGSRFNDFFTSELMEGALDCLHRHGVTDDQIDTAWVPGGFEIPIAAKRFRGHRSLCRGDLRRLHHPG